MERLVIFALLVAGAATLSPSFALASESGGRQWQFSVRLDGKPIGYHNFKVRHDGDRQVLESEASFDVKFLFVTAFRYRHKSTEVWSNGCLSSIDAVTNSNGKKLQVRGAAADNSFDLMRTDGSSALSGCVQSFAYWNPTVLESQQLLNSQTGDYEDVSLTFERRDLVQVGDKSVDALRYQLSARAGDITLWYASSDDTWIGLEAPAKGGRKITYDLQSGPLDTTVTQAGSRVTARL